MITFFTSAFWVCFFFLLLLFLKIRDRFLHFSMVSQVDITWPSSRAASSPPPHVLHAKIFALSSSPPRSIHQPRLSSSSMMLLGRSPPSSSSIIRRHLSSSSLRLTRSTRGSCWAGMDISSSWVVWHSFIWAELNIWRDCKRREGFYRLRRVVLLFSSPTVWHRPKRRILCCLLRWTRSSPRQKTRRRSFDLSRVPFITNYSEQCLSIIGALNILSLDYLTHRKCYFFLYCKAQVSRMQTRQ